MFKDVTVFLGRAWRNVNRRISRVYVSLFAQKTSYAMTRYGSKYGGWYAPDDMPKGALCYCIGVGQDATFDFALAELGAEVHSFDPTPVSIAYSDQHLDKAVTFHPWGLWDKDDKIRFYVPEGASHTSHFVHDLHNTGKYHEVPVYKLSTIQQKLGHEGDIFLLKMDIEGAWYEALIDFISAGTLPHYLGIEFDSPAPVWRVGKIVSLLQRNGYRMVIQEKDNVTFRLVQSA